MQISFGILAALLSASSLVAASPTQSVGDLMLDLNSKAISALENAQAPTSRKKCTIANANVRRDWKALSKKGRKAYINAVLCLRKKPSKADPSFAPGARTRYDDFVAVHINQTRTIHATGNFFTWHRYYTWAYEKALRDECGYKGTQPYWNWFETGDFATNPLFDGSETSMSGDGEFFKHNGSVSGTGLIFLPSGNGGGCIKKGPFAGATANLGPPSPGMDGMEATATPLEYYPRCLRRDLSRYTIDKWMTLPNLYNVTLGDASRSIQIMQDEFQGRFPDRFLGLHGAGHFAIGGDSSDLYSSSNEPVFFLHHAMVDRVYWIWQALHPKQARDIAGTITIGNRPPSRDALKSDPLNMGVNAAEITIDDALDTMSGSPFCYIYLTVSALPAADSNGQLSDLMLDKRNLLDPRAVCKASDPNNQAFKKNQANGSAFCSTYIQSTVLTTITPVIRSTSLKVTATTTTLIGVTTVRTTTFLVTVTTTTKTDLTTVTQTSTALVTDFTTKTLTNTATNRITNTKAVQVAVTDVEQATQRITKGATTTVTVDVDTTVTTNVTDASTVDVLTTISITVSTFVAALTPTVYVPSTEVHCNVVGYGDDNNYWSGGSGQSIKDPSFSVCRDFCLSNSEAASFRFNSNECDCYNGTVRVVVTPDASAPWTWYDMLCGSANKPSKRAVKAVQIPDYLPSKAPSDVSSACSCLIASPSAPMTTTITAKASRTVTTTQTRTNTFSVNKLRSTFVTDRKTSTSTSSSKTTKTGSQTITQTNRKSATVTKPATVTVTNFNTVTVTNTNVIEATSYNTLYFTNVDTVAATEYNTVVVTNAEGFTVTQYYTTVQTDVATSVITPDAVTVTSGTITVWGS
ncbi:hypothetical protein HZS61_014901 [Fusarium oxysporum f. sp. conglutinans]|uniref:Tyrosinase copper-binding domain-containing protein n=2 Tax=Fusarium oxysporum f. sp. conglutinans TaxID=100902 RepID=A0A8H6GM20_FUSOX|nr:hypothetical protein HZS61_014901 [Fusarium oxysporum f. sp. conglutinans]